MSLAPGTRFGVYEVAVLIGTGRMGNVHRPPDARAEARGRADDPLRNVHYRCRTGPATIASDYRVDRFRCS